MDLTRTRWRIPTAHGAAPVLMVAASDRPPAGVALVYHGLQSSKDQQVKELDSLARAGFMAAGIDAVGHGERRFPDLDAWMHRDGDTHRNFIQLVKDTVEEIPTILDALERETGERQGRFGIAGISMGGYVAYRAVLVEPRLRACVPILGSPDWSLHTRRTGDPAFLAILAESPHLHPSRFPPVALLAINAGLDENVHPGESRQFVSGLRPHYRDLPGRLEYREYPESGHFMRARDWDDAWNATLGWFHRFLPETPDS